MYKGCKGFVSLVQYIELQLVQRSLVKTIGNLPNLLKTNVYKLVGREYHLIVKVINSFIIFPNTTVENYFNNVCTGSCLLIKKIIL